jgi:hypothetical protein
VSWCIIEIEVDTSKRLPTLAVAEIPFDVRQNRCTKELRIVPHPGGQGKKTMGAVRRPNNAHQAFWSEFFVLFESKKWPSLEPSRIMGKFIMEP